MNSKGRYPFRIGCTSYVLPDEILPNVRYMAERIDDIELVLFESGEWSNMPDKQTVASMQLIADKHDITYSVHFPIDCRAGANNPGERERFRSTVTDIIRLTEPLPVSGYLLHLEGLEDESAPDEVNRWLSTVEQFCRELAAAQLCAPERICIENLGYDPLLHSRIVDAFGFSHCVDLGHLWRYGQDWLYYLNQVIDKTGIIHLHGVEESGDHKKLELHAQQEQLQQLMPFLKNYAGVVTLEVFSEEDTFSSLTLLEDLWHQSL